MYNYVLRSKKDNKWYTGFTHNLRERFRQHNNNEVLSTKGRGPFEIIYYEACNNQQDATMREKYLKSGMGKRYLRNRLKRSLFLTGLITFTLSILFAFPFLASATSNTTNYGWGENVGWANFNSTDGGVTVTTAGLTGYLWLENIGWIQLDYDGVAGATNTTSTNWGIVNDGHGNLSGYAWGESIGWINFHPTDSQVTIDSSGNFTGYAWSENAGWIQFDHNQTTYKPTTAWYPRIITPSVSTGSSCGTISPSTATSVTYDANQTFTITPNTGCHITDVLVDGSSVGAQTSYTFTNVTATHTIQANFVDNGSAGGVLFLNSISQQQSQQPSTFQEVINPNYQPSQDLPQQKLGGQAKAELIVQIKQQLVALITQLIQILTEQAMAMAR